MCGRCAAVSEVYALPADTQLATPAALETAAALLLLLLHQACAHVQLLVLLLLLLLMCMRLLLVLLLQLLFLQATAVLGDVCIAELHCCWKAWLHVNCCKALGTSHKYDT